MKNLISLLLVASLFSSCSNPEKAGKDSSEANKVSMQSFYDKAMNVHDASMVDSFMASGFIEHQPFPGYPATIEGIKEGFKAFFTAFPDLNVKTNYMHAWGDTVMAHVTMSGTNSGSFMGMPATNKPFSIEGVDIVIIKDGKATEHWGYMEEMKMMEQLGMGPGAAPDSAHAK